MRVAVAGASGFIGRKLVGALAARAEIESIVGLSRTGRAQPTDPGKLSWRAADLADLDTTTTSLQGCTHAIYLVHSMSPQARLSQGSFDDFDLHQADNFARACRLAGVTKIFYLGGLLPPTSHEGDHELSDHLRSRLEVERVLASQGATLTTLRAGLILGPGGSSTEILVRLVRRLPIMLAPRWTSTISEPVAEADVLRGIVEVVLRPELQGQTWDLTAGQPLSYLDLMRLVAQTCGVKRSILPVPIFTPTLSRLWVSLVTGAPRALVYPLVKSLTHAMRSRTEHDLLAKLGQPVTSIVDAVRSAAATPTTPHSPYSGSPRFQGPSTVRSIQRIAPFSSKHLRSLGSIAEHYFHWLPRFLFGFIEVRKTAPDQSPLIRFELAVFGLPLLELRLSETPSGSAIERFQIVGGALSAGVGGYLEFRRIPSEGCVLTIVQDFVPRLPWFIYTLSQAPLHLFVMRRYGRSLLRTRACPDFVENMSGDSTHERDKEAP